MQKKKCVRTAILTMALLLCTVGAICFGGLRVSAGAAERTGSGTVEWNIDNNGVLTVTGTGDVERDEDGYLWDDRGDEIRCTVFNWTGMSDLSDLFWGCENLESVDFSGLDTSNVTNMRSMFWGCENLESVDFSGLDTSNVTDMRTMFLGCDELESVNLSSLNASNITDVSRMFSGCGQLETLKMPANFPQEVELPGIGWKDEDGNSVSSSVVLSASMTYARKLAVKWNIDRNGVLTVTGTGDLEKEYDDYEEEYIFPCRDRFMKSAAFNWTGMSDLADLFYDSSSLKSVDFSGLDTSNVTDLSGMFGGCENLESVDFSGLNTSNVTNMGGMFYFCGVTDVDFGGLDMSNVTNLSSMFCGCKNLKSVDFSGLNTSNVTNMGSMFMWCDSLTSVDFSESDTLNVTNMSYIFSGCKNLEELNLSGLITSHVTDMYDMFAGCGSLTSLDLSSFDISNVPKSDLFSFDSCYRLANIKMPANLPYEVELGEGWKNENGDPVSAASVLSVPATYIRPYAKWNIDGNGVLTVTGTGILERDKDGNASWYSRREEIQRAVLSCVLTGDLRRLFDGCIHLESIDLSGLDVSNITNVKDMLSGCGQLETLKMPANFPQEVELPGISWKDENGNPVSVAAVLSVPMTYTRSIVKWNIDNNGVLTVTGMGDLEKNKYWKDSFWGGDPYAIWRFPWYEKRREIKKAVFNWSGMSDLSDLLEGCYNLQSVDLNGLDTSNVTDMSGMFSFCDVTDLDLSGLDTSNVQDMSYMFNMENEAEVTYGSLRTLDISGFDTSNVTNMRGMFKGCEDLEKLDVSGFNTSGVTDMNSMFRRCSELERLDVSGFDTSSVTDMSNMFRSCSKLERLDVSGFDTSSVTDMSSMFNHCGSFHAFDIFDELDVSGFDTSSVTDMSSMFENCGDALENIDVSGFDTSNVTNMNSMFAWCEELRRLDVSGFDTSNVTDMGSMFQACDELEDLDLSSFNTSNVENMEEMFMYSESLTDLDLSGFDMTSVCDLYGIFEGCSRLIRLKTPANLPEEVELPGKIWRDEAGNEVFAAPVLSVPADYTRTFAEWTLDESGVLTITGKGDLKGFGGLIFQKAGVKTEIRSAVFNWSGMSDLSNLFSDCINLTSVDMSGIDISSVTDMSDMFLGCDSLTTLKMPANLPEAVGLPGTGWKDKNGNPVSVAAVLSVPMTYTRTLGETGDSGNQNPNLPTGGSNPPIQNPPAGGTTAVSNGDTVTDVKTAGTYTILSADTVAYAGTLSQAQAVTIPKTITTEKGTFQVTEIAKNAFKGNKKLTSITIGKNIKKIGKNAFFGCKNLKNIKVKTKGLKAVGKNALKGIHKNCKIKVPSAKLKDYQKKFKKKGQKASVKIIK